MARKKASDTSKKTSTEKKKVGRPKKVVEEVKVQEKEMEAKLSEEEEVDEAATLDADNDIFMNEFDMANEVENAPFEEPKDDCFDEEAQDEEASEEEEQMEETSDFISEVNHEENKRIKSIENYFGYSWNGQEIDY